MPSTTFYIEKIRILLPCALMCVFQLFGQSTRAKTERIIFDACSRNDLDCVYKEIRQQVFPILARKNKLLKDTLHVYLNFTINERNQPGLIQIRIDDQSEFTKQRMRQEIESALMKLRPYRVASKQRGPYPAWHTFVFDFIRATDSTWTFIDKGNVYKGGIIDIPPLFQNCIRSDYESDVACFTALLRNHVASNFQYPIDAKQEGIEGRTYTSFTIDAKGRVINIRSSGTHSYFEEEGIRIISKLPRFVPGLRNGKPENYDFIVPIAFRLNGQ